MALAAIFLAALTLSLIPPGVVSAAGQAHTGRSAASSAMDMVQAVNAFRASFGLEAYQVDGSLMAEAQSHSDYQAAIQSCTHLRADGSGPGAHGISAENIACGNNLSAQDAIYGQWTDQLHTATLNGPDTGQVGAGVAVSGSMVYYTLAVRRGEGEFLARAPLQSAPENLAAPNVTPGPTEPPIGPVATTSPNADGSIAHIVRYGETLVDIAQAYGVPLNDLIGINQLDPRNPIIYENQPLLIRLAFTATPYLSPTATLRPPTRTPQPSRTPRPTRTATAVLTATATLTPTQEPLVQLPSLDDLGAGRSVLAYAFIGISLVGLVVLAWSSFKSPKG